VEHAARDLLAEVEKLESGCPKFTDAVDLELFSLLLHVVKEKRQILRDLVIANQVLGILTSV